MFSRIEKVVLTLLSSFVVFLIVALGVRIAGFTEVSEMMLGAGLACFGVGVVVGFIAFMKYIWFDA